MEELHRAILDYLRAQHPRPSRPSRGREVAIYARVATVGQHEMAGLDDQVAACLRHPRATGEAVELVYREVADGDTLVRPRLAELRAAIAHGRVATVLVTGLDRLARDPALLAALLAEWAAAGVHVVTVESP